MIFLHSKIALSLRATTQTGEQTTVLCYTSPNSAISQLLEQK